MFARILAVTVLVAAAPAQSTISYYFAHIAAGGPWRTTFTYVNQTSLPVTCVTAFKLDPGGAPSLSFNGASVTSTTDIIPAGGIARRQTDSQPSATITTGWALANCTGPVKASALFRSYNGSTPNAEASVPAMLAPATQFVTYSDQTTGVAYANPSASAASVSFTAKDARGNLLGAATIALAAGAHGSSNVGPLLSIAPFQGSITVASTQPIVSLSLNAEAAPVISSLPPGQPDGSASGAATYYFPHIAANNVWRTTFTYVNATAQSVTCITSFNLDPGGAPSLTFSGSAVTSTTDVIPAGGIARRQTDAQPNAPLTTGWAMAQCTGPVKASALFREYSGNTPQGEASVIASNSPVSQFVTYSDQSTGLAIANPATVSASVTVTAQNPDGSVAGAATQTLAAGAHTMFNVGPILHLTAFQGSVTITSSSPIAALSLNAEAFPVFSSLPPGDGAAFQVYGAWHCSNDSCTWRTVRNMTDFDNQNHWMIDRGDGTGLPSINLVVLSFVQPTKLLNLTNDPQTVNGIPIGMNSAIVKYFTSRNVRVMLSLGGSTFVSDWDQALSINATQLGINAANAAKAMGVGLEIDYENNTAPDLTDLQTFINAYRSVNPYDPSGANPAARLTIDLAAGDQYLVALCQKATADWLSGTAPLLDFANATVANGQPDAATAEANWIEHAAGRPKNTPPIPPLAPARFTAAVRLNVGTAVEPECNNFAASLQNSTGVFGQTMAPAGAGVTTGMLGYMFWGAESQAASCAAGVGSGAKSYNIPVPLPPLRQQ